VDGPGERPSPGADEEIGGDRPGRPDIDREVAPARRLDEAGKEVRAAGVFVKNGPSGSGDPPDYASIEVPALNYGWSPVSVGPAGTVPPTTSA
jgi:hypothetical protein